MNENRRQILEMLSTGKVTAEEAERLLSAVEVEEPASGTRAKPKYLRVMVEADASDHGHGATKVNIRVPMQLLRAGVKLASLIPIQARHHLNDELRKQGLEIDLTQIKPENLEELIEHVNDLTVDVDDAKNKVRIFCE